jgi:hypothetical protein
MREWCVVKVERGNDVGEVKEGGGESKEGREIRRGGETRAYHATFFFFFKGKGDA